MSAWGYHFDLSVYYPELKKLACITLEIGTYTTDTVKIVVSFLFYLVHPDTKKLQEVTFYVAKKMVVFCCPSLQYLHLDLYTTMQKIGLFISQS